jgi:hypothetical protein
VSTQPQPQQPPEKPLAQILSESSDLIESLFLVRNGVPFDVAFSLDSDMRLAWCVVIGELEGRVFNWPAMRWEPPK